MELRKENSGLLSQVKVLESECKMQSAELDELRKVRKKVESGVLRAC